MTNTRLLTSLVVFMAATPVAAAPPLGQRLIEAARATPVRAIDYDADRCDGRSVERWLSDLVGPAESDIAWTAGRCQIVGPGIDAGSRWCVQAQVTLKRPMRADDRPMIEIFFEQPVQGRPGRAYAFRGLMLASDGMDMSRFRKDFEYDWTSRFSAPSGSIVDCETEE